MKPSAWQEFREKAAKSPRKIILADGDDIRIIQAAARAHSERIAQPILIGNKKNIEVAWRRFSVDIPDVLDPQHLTPQQHDLFLKTLSGIAKFQKFSSQELEDRVRDPLVLGCLALRLKQVEGFIGGATRTTTDTLRAVFSIIGLQHGMSTLFGFFLIEKKESAGAPGSLVLLGDCAVIPEPSPKQLAQIGIHSAKAYTFFTGDEAKVAFLSFSTHGSAEHPFVEKVRQALAMAREKAPALPMDGEWQADAALDHFTAGVKGVSDSVMAGLANVLVVPDLNCGNIAYKLVQRLGGCRAVGPVLWGPSQPANDLSRGCTMEDVLDMIALTGIQAQAVSPIERSQTSMKVQVP
jgi:phosphate acetyltransferase